MLILATDMSRHSEIMEEYKQITKFSFKNKKHVDLVNPSFCILLTVASEMFWANINWVRMCMFLCLCVQQGMIMLILATDMARHSEILEAFKSKLDHFDFKNDDHVNSVNIFFKRRYLFIKKHRGAI